MGRVELIFRQVCAAITTGRGQLVVVGAGAHLVVDKYLGGPVLTAANKSMEQETCLSKLQVFRLDGPGSKNLPGGSTWRRGLGSIGQGITEQ